TEILAPQSGKLKKLFTFAPVKEADAIRQALFDAGAGHICHYSECSFNTEGTGTFKGGENTAPFVGKPGVLHREQEMKIEVIFPAFLQEKILKALWQVHPYEEVAYDIVELANHHPAIGAGIVGQIPKAMDELAFLQKLKENFGTPVIKHTKLTGRKIQRVAICGGAGSFLISNALAAGAGAFITADVKYHEFFDANDKILFIDVGHFESEQFTIDLLQEVLEQKFPNFAVLKTEVRTNPVFYY
ncbi:MAG TPA: Nif3-like dinuclear metal center hexameric protein, partial [Chitinophagaceae bacterium]|nr:Nif3-like dinuclear metal center hexameric protein [Chitinophagaceae bacterium]